MPKLNQERRRHLRVEGNIPLKICTDDFDLVSEASNLSRTGAYCRVNQYVEPMTKLKIQLLLPFKRHEKVVTKKVACGGVVVRIEALPDSEGFHVAIYFNDIQERCAEIISEYINTTLESKTKTEA